MTIQQLKKLLLLTFLAITLSACTQADSVDVPETEKAFSYQIPESKDDGWLVGHLEDHQVNEQIITDLMVAISDNTYPGIDSITVVRNNTLLLHQDLRTELSQYDNWVGNEDLESHVVHSISKSFVSALVGIAADQGYIADVKTPVLDFFDYTEYQNWDPRKRAITLENVLSMQLGLEWDEWQYPFGDQRNSLTALTENHQDFVKALFDLPLIDSPGTQYRYNSVASISLGYVVEKSTGLPLETFAQQFLFEPLEIHQAGWFKTPDGVPDTSSGLFLKTRDLAKFGQLYLDGGAWNGVQIISNEWVEKSLQKSSDIEMNFTYGYGYQWWLGEFEYNERQIQFYSSRGFGGQFIIIVPEHDLVVAFTSHNYDNGLAESPFWLMENFILPAIRS